MIQALRKLLEKHHGRDVFTFRQGPFGLYLWDAEKGEHVRYDPFYRPEMPKRRAFDDPKQFKRAVDQRSTFLNRRKQAIRDSF